MHVPSFCDAVLHCPVRLTETRYAAVLARLIPLHGGAPDCLEVVEPQFSADFQNKRKPTLCKLLACSIQP